MDITVQDITIESSYYPLPVKDILMAGAGLFDNRRKIIW